MNYKEARVYLDQVSKYGSVLGLDNMRELLGRLGNPQKDLKFIHISGTNGKGSVLAYLSTVLSAAGYRTGRYLSPTLFSYREKIQVDGEKINRESLAAHVTAIAEATRDMQEKDAGTPTIFEVETVLAFLYFKEKKCDIVVLETGMGGLLDATNIIDTTVLEVIAPISMDHMEFLGDTLAKIASQKAGIIKPHTQVVSAPQEPEARRVIEETCQEKGCTLRTVNPEQIRDVRYGCVRQQLSYRAGTRIQSFASAGKMQMPDVRDLHSARVSGAAAWDCAEGGMMQSTEEGGTCGADRAADRRKLAVCHAPVQCSVRDWEQVEISLAGSYQIMNAAVALEGIEALRALGYQISEEQARRGMQETVWRGRFTVLGREPYIIMDGAHNPAAARTLRESLQLYFSGKRMFYIFGMFQDKDYNEVIRLTAPLAEHIITVETPGNPRALPARELAAAVAKVNPSVEAAESIAEAVRKSLANASPEDVVVIFGSLSYLGEAEREVQNGGRRNG